MLEGALPSRIERADQRDSKTDTIKEAPSLDREAREESAQIERAVELASIERQVVRSGTPRNIARTLAAGIFALNISAGDVFATEKKPEQNFTEEQQRTVEHVIGTPFPELKVKFEVEMPVLPGPEGKYVIHIGQTHQHPGMALWKAMGQRTVIEAQKKLEGVLLSAQGANGLRCIFSEGLAEDDVAPSLKEYVEKASSELDVSLARPVQNFEDFKSIAMVLSEHSRNMRNPIVFHYLGAKIAALSEKVSGALQSEAATPKDEAQKQWRLLIQADLTINVFSRVLKMGETSDPYTMGADWKMFMEGRMEKLCPSEDRGLNARAMTLLTEKEEADHAYWQKKNLLLKEWREKPEFAPLHKRLNELIEKEKTGLAEQERQEMESLREKLSASFNDMDNDPRLQTEKRLLEEATAAQDRAVLIEREKEVFRKIDGYDLNDVGSGRPLGNVVVLYGRGHDFSEALRQWNQGDTPHHPIQRGLIKLQLKD